MICFSGSYLHGRARSNEKTMGEEARRRERNTLKNFTAFPHDPSSTVFWFDLVFGFRATVSLTLPTTKEKELKNRQLRRLGKEGFGRFGVNNSVVAVVPFPPLLARRIVPSPSLVPRVLSYRRDGYERTLITSETPPPRPTQASNYWFNYACDDVSRKNFQKIKDLGI